MTILPQNHIQVETKTYLDSPIIPQLEIQGMPALSEIIGNFRTQQINLIVAETGFGKSDLMIDLALKLAGQKNQILFFSAEMGRDKTIPRFMANRVDNIDKKAAEQFHLDYQNTESKAERDDLAALAAAHFEGLPLLIEYSRTLEEIIESVIKHKEEFGTQFVFVDHILILNTLVQFSSQTAQIDFILQEFEKIALNYNICFICATQFNNQGERGSQHGRRHLGEVAGSRAVSHIVENILYLFESEEQSKKNEQSWKVRETSISTLKKRNGRGGKINFTYTPHKGRFFELPNQTKNN